MLFMSIQCNMSLLSLCIVGHPIRVNQTSLSRSNQFHRFIKGGYNGIHSRVRSLLLSPSPPTPLCHLLGELLCDYDLVLPLGEFLAPTLLKITNCLVLSLLILIKCVFV